MPLKGRVAVMAAPGGTLHRFTHQQKCCGTIEFFRTDRLAQAAEITMKDHGKLCRRAGKKICADFPGAAIFPEEGALFSAEFAGDTFFRYLLYCLHVSSSFAFLQAGLHRQFVTSRPFIDRCFVVSYFFKANCFEDHGCVPRSNTHGSVENEIIIRIHSHGSQKSDNLLG